MIRAIQGHLRQLRACFLIFSPTGSEYECLGAKGLGFGAGGTSPPLRYRREYINVRWRSTLYCFCPGTRLRNRGEGLGGFILQSSKQT